ncbi:MAG: hypothetical protein ABFD89_28875 [Bryobacteraceae bacterium]
MLNRRSILAAIPLIPMFAKATPAKLPEGSEILRSFDARDWASAFTKIAKAHPSIPFDEETMTTWFANALMRGYDEHRWGMEKFERDAGKQHLHSVSEDAIRAAVAQGWCSPANSRKEMDCDLAESIVERLMALKS